MCRRRACGSAVHGQAVELIGVQLPGLAGPLRSRRRRAGPAPGCTPAGAKATPTRNALKLRPPVPCAMRNSKSGSQEVYTSNYRVYGARKIWCELNRQEHAVARCTVERLMRELGITGAVRGRKVITTITDQAAERAPDLSTATSSPVPPTAAGSPTSRTSPPGTGSSTSPSSWTPSPVASPAGPPLPPRRPGSSWTPWRWRCGSATGTDSRTHKAS